MLDDQFVYFPAAWEPGDWAARSGLPLEDIWFEASDGTRLHGWYVQAPESVATLLWCHGNAGNIIHRLDNMAALHRRGISLLIFDYRGYGQSAGHPSEEGLYQDAQAAYACVTTTLRVPPTRLILFGRSLGAAVIGEVAAAQQAAGLILETPFPSVEAVAKAHYRGMPMHLLVQSRFALTKRLPQVRMPVLVVHGDQDTVIPMALGRLVYDAARAPKDFYVIHGADHNNTYIVGGDPYFDRLLSFIRETIATP